MQGIDIQAIVCARLDDMAEQIKNLYDQGRFDDAEMLKAEGLQLADAMDNGEIFMYINDLTQA